MDPLSAVALGAAVGGAAGKFVERAWDSGEKWLKSYFENHREKAKQQAQNNSVDFLNQLAEKVKSLETSNQVNKEKIETAQDHPDFSMLLQKAMLSSAQTDSTEKHSLLARMVAERLKTEPESLYALASKMGCDAIAHANMRQLKIMGLQVNLLYVRPTSFPSPGLLPEHYADYMIQWLEQRTAPYRDLNFSGLDLMHLESLSCLKWDNFLSRDLTQVFAKQPFSFDVEKYKQTELGSKICTLWDDIEKGLKSVTLTTVGQLIGVIVSDLLSGTNTSFSGWN